MNFTFLLNQAFFSKVKYIVVDEYSMLSARMLELINRRLKEMFPTGQLFGNKSIILVGDINQLPPVQGVPLYAASARSSEGQLGLQLIKQFAKAFVLSQPIRQASDRGFFDLLNSVSDGSINNEQYAAIRQRFRDIPQKMLPNDDTSMLFSSNSAVDRLNQSILRGLQSQVNPVAILPAGGVYTATSHYMQKVYLAKGAKVILIVCKINVGKIIWRGPKRKIRI